MPDMHTYPKMLLLCPILSSAMCVRHIKLNNRSNAYKLENKLETKYHLSSSSRNEIQDQVSERSENSLGQELCDPGERERNTKTYADVSGLGCHLKLCWCPWSMMLLGSMIVSSLTAASVLGAMSGFIVPLQPGAVMMSMICVITKGHRIDVCGLFCYLKPCYMSGQHCHLRPYSCS